jgi:hypothetical protein
VCVCVRARACHARLLDTGKVIPVQTVEALRVARGWSSHIFKHSVHRWRQGCQPYAPAAFYPPGRFLALISVRGWFNPRDIVRPEGSGKLKNPPHPGLEPATFQLVAWCLNQLRYRMPHARLLNTATCKPLPVLHQAPRHENLWRNGGIAPLIINSDITWEWLADRQHVG